MISKRLRATRTTHFRFFILLAPIINKLFVHISIIGVIVTDPSLFSVIFMLVVIILLVGGLVGVMLIL